MINLGNDVYTLKDETFGDFGALDKLQEVLQSYDEENGDGPPENKGDDSDNQFSLSVGAGFGGKGGAGGNGGYTYVQNTGDIQTYGPSSEGILAQSVGGGGGIGGIANPSTLNTITNLPTVSGTMGIGGDGGAGGDGGYVKVSNSGNVATAGDASFGIHAQRSAAAAARAASRRHSRVSSTFSVAIGGDGGANGNGGKISIAATAA